MAPVETAFNPFIISTDVNKTDAKTRKLIRSHVMLGKNRGKRRSNKRHQHCLDDADASFEVPASASDDDVRSVVPTQVGNEYSFIRLAVDVEPALIHGALKFSTQSKRDLFPLEPCIAFTSGRTQWIGAIFTDALFCHAAIFASLAAAGRGSSRDTNGSIASQHFASTVKLLRLRLESKDPVAALSDTTLMVIVILAMSALLSGQEELTRSHLLGVRRIVEMRGAFAGFGNAAKLLIIALRCDVGLALSTGEAPVFFHRPLSGPATSPPPHSDSHARSAADSTLPTLDASLTHILHTLRLFAKSINTASKTHRRLSEQTFLDAMAGSIYPLLHLHLPTCALSETFRLALLAFCSNAFLQWQGTNLNYKSLPSKYRRSLLGLARRTAVAQVEARAILWLLVMGGMALFTTEEDRAWLLPWVRDTVDSCSGLESWDVVRDAMKMFVWVDFIHDAPGERLYREAMGPTVSRSVSASA